MSHARSIARLFTEGALSTLAFFAGLLLTSVALTRLRDRDPMMDIAAMSQHDRFLIGIILFLAVAYCRKDA